MRKQQHDGKTFASEKYRLHPTNVTSLGHGSWWRKIIAVKKAKPKDAAFEPLLEFSDESSMYVIEGLPRSGNSTKNRE